jgi:hypothetical protein
MRGRGLDLDYRSFDSEGLNRSAGGAIQRFALFCRYAITIS